VQDTDPSSRQRSSLHEQADTRNTWCWAPKGGPTPRHTGRQTVGRKFNPQLLQQASAVPYYEPDIRLWGPRDYSACTIMPLPTTLRTWRVPSYDHTSKLPITSDHQQKQTPWPLVRKRTIPSDRHLSMEFSVNFCG
jgi:hypothetical protein